jgi:hypothetical protein
MKNCKRPIWTAANTRVDFHFCLSQAFLSKTVKSNCEKTLRIKAVCFCGKSTHLDRQKVVRIAWTLLFTARFHWLLLSMPDFSICAEHYSSRWHFQSYGASFGSSPFGLLCTFIPWSPSFVYWTVGCGTSATTSMFCRTKGPESKRTGHMVASKWM